MFIFSLMNYSCGHACTSGAANPEWPALDHIELSKDNKTLAAYPLRQQHAPIYFHTRIHSLILPGRARSSYYVFCTITVGANLPVRLQHAQAKAHVIKKDKGSIMLLLVLALTACTSGTAS